MQFSELPLTSPEQTAHENAVNCALNYRRSEAQLLNAIDHADRLRVFEKFRLASTFAYCLKYLKLTEACANYIITVARKSREIPELREAIAADEISISKAARICSVLTPENKELWLAKAKVLSKKDLERDVARCTPDRERRAHVRPISENYTRVAFDASDALMEKLKRAMEIGNAQLVMAIETALDTYLEKNDPLKKAQRAKPNAARAASKDIPAESRHKVNLRDGGRCTAVYPDGSRCTETRNLHIHHIIKRSEGGSHDPDNLTTLCRFHHKNFHEFEELSR